MRYERYEVTEVCPHCETENTMFWNTAREGYTAHCPRCGKKMMLCDECLHADDNKNQYCDWNESTGCWRNKTFHFDWNEFTEEDFVNYCALMENSGLSNIDYIGCVGIENCFFEFIVKDNNLDFILHVKAEVYGETFEDTMISLPYDEFKKTVESTVSKFIRDQNIKLI